MKLLSRSDILSAFEMLAQELDSTGATSKEEILVAGGAAVVVLYGTREATKDVDAFAASSTDSSALRRAAKRVASALDLPENWLNDGAKGYLNGVLPGKVLLDRPSLLVRALAPQQLLAMKLSAWRDDMDIADAKVLLREFSGERAEVWGLVEPFLVPGRELKARYAFDDLWEAERGS
jgi:Nucleotidyltransferase of unknown function (DUF6036)